MICLLAISAIGGAVFKFRSSDSTAPTEKTAHAQPASNAAPNPSAAPRQTSEHNWAKHSLDRAADVKRQVAAQRKSNDVP